MIRVSVLLLAVVNVVRDNLVLPDPAWTPNERNALDHNLTTTVAACPAALVVREDRADEAVAERLGHFKGLLGLHDWPAADRVNKAVFDALETMHATWPALMAAALVPSAPTAPEAAPVEPTAPEAAPVDAEAHDDDDDGGSDPAHDAGGVCPAAAGATGGDCDGFGPEEADEEEPGNEPAGLAWVLLEQVASEGKVLWGGVVAGESRQFITLILPPIHDNKTGVDYPQRWVRFPQPLVNRVVESDAVEAAAVTLQRHLDNDVVTFLSVPNRTANKHLADLKKRVQAKPGERQHAAGTPEEVTRKNA